MSEVALPTGWPDVRGWRVGTPEGEDLGTVTGLVADASGREARYALVAPCGGGALRIPVDAMSLDTRGSTLLVEGAVAALYGHASAAPSRPAEMPVARSRSAVAADAPGDEAARLTRSEEELSITKRRVTVGDVGVRKQVEIEHVAQPVTTQRQEVTVERRPAAPGMDGATAKPTMTDGEIIVPIVEEELVVTKRLVVKEELVIRTRTVTEHHTIEADLRKERVDVNRDDLAPRGAGLVDEGADRTVR